MEDSLVVNCVKHSGQWESALTHVLEHKHLELTSTPNTFGQNKPPTTGSFVKGSNVSGLLITPYDHEAISSGEANVRLNLSISEGLNEGLMTINNER
ncbi:MAG: hypothetical protein ACKEQK_00240 [Candidatus Hodgkinia cicadicola]